MGFNIYLSLLVEVEGATSIRTILLIDVDVENFSPYIYVLLTPWVKHNKATVKGAPSLGNFSCSKLKFSPPLLSSMPNPDDYYLRQAIVL